MSSISHLLSLGRAINSLRWAFIGDSREESLMIHRFAIRKRQAPSERDINQSIYNKREGIKFHELY